MPTQSSGERLEGWGIMGPSSTCIDRGCHCTHLGSRSIGLPKNRVEEQCPHQYSCGWLFSVIQFGLFSFFPTQDFGSPNRTPVHICLGRGSELQQNRALLTLSYILKEMVTMALPSQRRVFHEFAGSMLQVAPQCLTASAFPLLLHVYSFRGQLRSH